MGPKIIVRDGGCWRTFNGLTGIHSARRLSEVDAVLSAVKRETDAGRYAAGFIAYEAAPAFDDALAVHESSGLLAYFACFEQMVDGVLASFREGAYAVSALTPAVSRGGYEASFLKIRDELSAGNTYQVNYTMPFTARISGDTFAYFSDRVRRNAPPYAAYIDTGETVIASFSPELFFSMTGGDIVMRPMKGTRRRADGADDGRMAEELAASEKDRAENLMIVDMVRNDLGRIAVNGSVAVPSLYTIERHPYVWQMTSTVCARTAADTPAIMRALFPCASVTGAPKAETMRIIRECEPSPRGVYTGAIGFIAPGRSQFSVAIRTAVIDVAAEQLSYHAGSGIVWDSRVEAEYDECIAKTHALDAVGGTVTLLESLRFDPGFGYYLLERHLSRLRSSAACFGIPADIPAIRNELASYADGITAAVKVRLRVSHDGISISHEALLASPTIVRIACAAEPVSADEDMLRHKHTDRGIYDRAKASRPDADDVLLWNTRGEVTEASSSNIVYRMHGRYYTPPVSSGLLPGTLRAELIERGVAERVLMKDELAAVDRLYLINSVRKCRRAVLILS